jgi:uncharacterized membrane protein
MGAAFYFINENGRSGSDSIFYMNFTSQSLFKLTFMTLSRRSQWRWRKVLQYFVQGLLVTAPLAITIYLIYWFVSSVDSWLPLFQVKDAEGKIINRNYGLGFVAIIIALTIIGFLSSNFLTSRLFSLFDTWLERTPGVKFIYSSIKDFFEAFAGNKRKFKKAVLVSIFQPDIFQVGFITDEDTSEFGLKGCISVYVPNAYALTGQLYIIPKEKVRILEDVSAADALKYAISGGVSEVEEHIATSARK